MHERFNDPVRAATYVCSGLIADYPEEEVEITAVHGAKKRTRTCTPGEAGHILELFCTRYPRVTVHFTPDDEDGTVAKMWCHCEKGSHLKCCDHSRQGRPRITVSVSNPRNPAKQKNPPKLFLKQTGGAIMAPLSEDKAGKADAGKLDTRNDWR